VHNGYANGQQVALKLRKDIQETKDQAYKKRLLSTE
jgi:hypothetical protein